MKINIDYIDNSIILENGKIMALEIENKYLLFRLIKNFTDIDSGNFIDEIKAFDNDNKEINISNKILVLSDFFNFNLDTKKYLNQINKIIINNIKDSGDNTLLSLYQKLLYKYNKVIKETELPIVINNEINVESLVKMIKLKLNLSDNLLDNLLSLIDLEKIAKANKFLIFVNLKLYLTEKELEELYKYAIYNEVKLMLIDSKTYGCTINFENKLIIDNNLVEFMLK